MVEYDTCDQAVGVDLNHFEHVERERVGLPSLARAERIRAAACHGSQWW